MNIWTAQIGLCGIDTDLDIDVDMKLEIGGRQIWEEGEGRRNECDQNKLYTYMTISKN